MLYSPDGFLYEVKLDDSSKGTWADEYMVTIKTITPEDHLAFNHSSVIDKEFTVDLQNKPKITFAITLDRRHNDMVSAIGKAYLKYLGH
jgi:hypothetical protein